MPAFRFVGFHDPLANGKFLLEILLQLRNFGKGRIVTKTEWQHRWPNSATFCRIVHVQPLMDRWLRHGTVYADWTVCGKPMGIYSYGARVIDRADWVLIHKRDEKRLLTSTAPAPDIARPATIPLPPLMLRMMRRQEKLTGVAPDQSIDRVAVTPQFDAEFDVLRQWTRSDESIVPKKDIYDVSSDLYLKQYGKRLPTRIDLWTTGEH